VDEKPVALKWASEDDIVKDSSNTNSSTTCDPCDPCDPTSSQTEKNPVSVPDGKSRAEGSTKKDPESIGSHRAHRSQLTDNNPTDNYSVPGMDEVIDEKNAGQITEEIQDTGNVIKTESRATHPLEASLPSPQFECYFEGSGQRFSSRSELIAHMDKESADAREKRQLDGC
jgi:hypothetical protein